MEPGFQHMELFASSALRNRQSWEFLEHIKRFEGLTIDPAHMDERVVTCGEQRMHSGRPLMIQQWPKPLCAPRSFPGAEARLAGRAVGPAPRGVRSVGDRRCA